MIVTVWRGLWADHANAALREIGIDAALDHRSAARRGIGHEPEERLGPAAAAMERRGVRTEIGDRNRRRRRRNRDRERLVAEGNAVIAAIAALEREVTPSNPMAVVDRALAEAANRPGAVAEALDAAGVWGSHAPAILTARVARLSREGRQQVVVACRRLGGHLAGALLDEMVGDAHQRQRVR